jgi:hypothetical protein
MPALAFGHPTLWVCARLDVRGPAETLREAQAMQACPLDWLCAIRAPGMQTQCGGIRLLIKQQMLLPPVPAAEVKSQH